MTRMAVTGTLADGQNPRTAILADVATIDLTGGTTTGLTRRDLGRTQSHTQDLVTPDGTPLDEMTPPEVAVAVMAEETMIVEGLIPGHGVEGKNRLMDGRGLVAETTGTGIGTGIEASTTATMTVEGEMAHPHTTVAIILVGQIMVETGGVLDLPGGGRLLPRRLAVLPTVVTLVPEARGVIPLLPGGHRLEKIPLRRGHHPLEYPSSKKSLDPVKNNEQLDIKPSPVKQEPAVWGRSPTPIKAEPTPAPLPPKREYPSEPPVNVINARPVDDRVKDNDVKMRDQSDASIPTHPRHHLRTANLDRVQSPHSRLDSPSGSSHPIQRRSSPPRFNRQVSDRHSRYDGPPTRLNKPYHHKHEPDKIYPQLASAELNRIFPLKFEEPIPLPSELQQMHAKREQFRKSALIFCKQRAALVQVELQLAEALREVDLASIDVATAKSRQRAIEHTITTLEAVPTSEPSSSSGQPSEVTNTIS
ncbi:hypothetical protein PLEOSDRAFT_1099758 [Pleurotus ostreatus PC15]|uniref:Uncharacterized protein n=1 Tax=Pleurotus ostreatus (strain PC15) TaxID=1137138 RepID=A0A067P3I3_PLEO1|nr:hypothetical protein PLEOSDRAFT_1099758 [Pleurotus ostreatus PC15]